MRHQCRVIAVHRAWRVEQHGQQILPDIPNPCCVLLQAVHDETDMLAVQLQQLRPHDLSRIIISADTDTVTGAANRFLYQLGDLIKLLTVNVRIICQNIVVDVLQNQFPIAFKRFLEDARDSLVFHKFSPRTPSCYNTPVF